jgi:hypothetical protein
MNLPNLGVQTTRTERAFAIWHFHFRQRRP